MSDREIVFCFPYRGAGGVSNQFLRLAEEIASRGNRKVFVVDYYDGFMAKNIKNKNVYLIEYNDNHDVVINKNSIVIFQVMTPWSIFPSLKIDKESRVLFWHCHPNNLIPSIPFYTGVASNSVFRSFVFIFLHKYWKTLKIFHKLLIKNNALIYIDGVNADSTNIFLNVTDPKRKIIPIPIPTSSKNILEKHKLINKEMKNIRFCWVGRIADFKYPILLYSLVKLNAISSKYVSSFEVDIIGDGEYLDFLKSDVTDLPNIKVNFLGELSRESVNEYLMCTPDVMLAMGTSAVEGASIGLPVILLNFSYSKVDEGYVYNFLHRDNPEASVGQVIDNKNLQPNNTSLENCINEVLDNYEALSIESKNYADSVHSLNKITDMLLEQLTKTSLTWGAMEDSGVLNKGLLYSVKKLMQGK